jgi:signal transduction histidine kinase
MKQESSKLVMIIKDNGKGITRTDWDKTRSFGLMGMRERANSIGGKLEIISTPGKGTTVKLTIPMK